ncbi:MAG: ribosome maturation factor RimM [Clostridiales bacterium]|nr:ribosome maturation factor RimM [Clostridiales bacterium]
MKQFLEVGKIVNTHGLKGEVKFELWCDDINYLSQFKTLYLDASGIESLSLISVRPQKNSAILKFSEIDSIDKAEKYKNRVLFGNRNDAKIKKGSEYIQDIIGCIVLNEKTDENYGVVEDVCNFGASDILDVNKGGNHTYIPVIPDIVLKIDTKGRFIKIKPMKGLFDED